MDCPDDWEGTRRFSLPETVLIFVRVLQATLLLPVENGGSADITADFMRDHVALCESPSGDNIPIVTLSGLRGMLVG